MIRLCLWLLAHTFYRVQARGRENLPQRGPALLVCNHVSFVDAFLIAACVRRPIRFLMYRPFYETWGIHWLAKLMGAIPVAAEDPPRRIVESLRAARKHLRDGELVCLFAEAAYMRGGNLLPFRHALRHITRAGAAPIIPVCLDRVWGEILGCQRNRFFFKWPRRIPYPVRVNFGTPLPPDSTVFAVRQAVAALSAEAFARRDGAQRPLPELFLETARRNWRRLAMADSSGRELSFGRALVGAILFRRWILRHCNEEKMIGILLPPSAPAALLNFGATLAGRIAVNLNYTTSAESLAAAIGHCGIKTILTSQKLLERFGIAKRPGMVMVEDIAQSFSRAAKLMHTLAALFLPCFVLKPWLLSRDVALDSLATIIFSSGSTGIPKGVMLSHRNIVSNVEGMQQALNVDRHDCLLGVLPFFHSFGYAVALWLPAISGFPVIYHTNPLEGRKVGQLCRKYGITLLVGTPTFVWEYIRRCEAEDFGALRVAIVGAEKMKPELAQAFKAKFDRDLFQGYGCTELSPVVSVETLSSTGEEAKRLGRKPGTVGWPIPGVAVKVADPESFEELPSERDGMLLVAGPSVMLGYLDDPEKTRQAIREGGWYVTGDVARLDQDGLISITDRLSRFSKIAGEMVPHLQVEEALHAALGSLEPKMVVTSVADMQKGEKLVVLHTKLEMNVEDLLRRLRDSALPKLWLPRKENFFEVAALPILGSGKLDLKQIKDAAKRLAAATRSPGESVQ